MGLMRARPGKVDSRFLLYAYLGAQFQEALRARTIHGSTVDRIPLIDMPAFPIRVPRDVAEQRAIAHILGTLDDKIQLIQRMNETLEAMARALFKSWFVEFDPPRAKVANLIRDGVLEIGDGYRAKNSEIGAPGLPFIRAGNLNNGFNTTGADLLREDSVAKAGSKICRVGDVAFTSKGTIGRFARVTEHTVRFVYSPQVCFWRSLDQSRLHPALLYSWMQSDDLGVQIAAVAGQTDMALYVSLQDQRQMSMPVFPQSQHTLARRIEPLLARRSLNTAETRTLAALRDTLLPKLVSGVLRIKDAKRYLRK
jgi:type I restriction enzyme S subunit